MIENVIVKELWAFAFNAGWASTSATVYVGTDYFTAPKITVQTNLSRVMGGGIAIADLHHSYHFTRDGEPENQPYQAPVNVRIEGEEALIVKTMSEDTILHAQSVTFNLRVKDMAAASTCTVFVHSGSLLNALVTRPDKIIDFLIGP